ncbi:unnamed protein product, partial [Acidithrix sp. C25]
VELLYPDSLLFFLLEITRRSFLSEVARGSPPALTASRYLHRGF